MSWLCGQPISGRVMAQAQQEAEEQEAERRRRQAEAVSAADLLRLRALEEQAAMANIARLRQGQQPQARPPRTKACCVHTELWKLLDMHTRRLQKSCFSMP